MIKRPRLPWLPMVVLSLLVTLWMLDGWLTRSASAVQKSVGAQAAGQADGDGAGQAKDEQPTAESSDVEGLLEGLNLELPGAEAVEDGDDASGDVPSDSGAETPPLIGAYLAMREAGSRLTAGELGEKTQAVQQRAIDLLDQIINMAQADEETGAAQSGSSQSSPNQESDSGEQQSKAEPKVVDAGEDATDGQPREESSGQQQSEDGRGDESAQQPDQSGEENSQGPAGDGNPDDQQIAFPAAGDAVPLDASGQAVWGHLPKRVRGLLRAETPTEYLPGYADEISAYFRALAEMKPDEP